VALNVGFTQADHRPGRQMATFHEEYDLLLTPGLATLPPRLGWLDMMMDDDDEYSRRVFDFSPFTVWFNLTGQPAMMLPRGQTQSSRPVAVQLVAVTETSEYETYNDASRRS
jgi:amidase